METNARLSATFVSKRLDPGFLLSSPLIRVELAAAPTFLFFVVAQFFPAFSKRRRSCKDNLPVRRQIDAADDKLKN